MFVYSLNFQQNTVEFKLKSFLNFADVTLSSAFFAHKGLRMSLWRVKAMFLLTCSKAMKRKKMLA